MKVVCVTANPAIDVTVHANNWRQGRVNRGQKIEETAGGKALGVAINLQNAGMTAIASGWLGENNEKTFIDTLKKQSVTDAFIRIPAAETRRCIKIIDENTSETTDINMPGIEIPRAAQQNLIDYLDEVVDQQTVLVFGGSLPPNVAEDFYAQMTAKFHARCPFIAVDTSEAALKNVMRSEILPQVIKPNLDELAFLCGRTLRNDPDIVSVGRSFVARGVKLVVISLGARGAWFINETEALHAQPPQVKVVSTVGAGDAMVAGMVRGMILGSSLSDIAKTATAYSAANVQHLGAYLPAAEIVEQLKNQVTIMRFED